MEAEFTEGLEKVQVQTEYLGDSERKGGSLMFAWHLKVFIEDHDLVRVSSQAPRNQLEDEDPGVIP